MLHLLSVARSRGSNNGIGTNRRNRLLQQSVVGLAMGTAILSLMWLCAPSRSPSRWPGTLMDSEFQLAIPVVQPIWSRHEADPGASAQSVGYKLSRALSAGAPPGSNVPGSLPTTSSEDPMQAAVPQHDSMVLARKQQASSIAANSNVLIPDSPLQFHLAITVCSRAHMGRYLSLLLLTAYANGLQPATTSLVYCKKAKTASGAPDSAYLEWLEGAKQSSLLGNLHLMRGIKVIPLSDDIVSAAPTATYLSALRVPDTYAKELNDPSLAQLPVVITEDDVIFSPDFIPVLQRAHARIVGQLDVREMAIGNAARRAEADTGNAIRSADPAHGHAFIINLYSPSLPGNASTLLRKYSVQAALGKLPKVKYSLRYGGIAWGYGVQGMLYSSAMRQRLLRVFTEVTNGSRSWPGYQDMILYWYLHSPANCSGLHTPPPNINTTQQHSQVAPASSSSSSSSSAAGMQQPASPPGAVSQPVAEAGSTAAVGKSAPKAAAAKPPAPPPAPQPGASDWELAATSPCEVFGVVPSIVQHIGAHSSVFGPGTVAKNNRFHLAPDFGYRVAFPAVVDGPDAW